MKAMWTYHRMVRAEHRWIDTPEVDAGAGVLAAADRELEATLDLDGRFEIRDIVWPLAWRLCLEPVRALLGESQAEWIYRCFEQNKTVTLRAEGDDVHVITGSERPVLFPAREFWPAMVSAGARVLALAERDRGPDNKSVGLLRSALETAQAVLRERGLA